MTKEEWEVFLSFIDKLNQDDKVVTYCVDYEFGRNVKITEKGIEEEWDEYFVPYHEVDITKLQVEITFVKEGSEILKEQNND